MGLDALIHWIRRLASPKGGSSSPQGERASPDRRTIKKAEQYRRRKITSVLAIVFTDIADSTKLREELGEVEYERLRVDYDGKVSQIIERGDTGAVVKSTGAEPGHVLTSFHVYDCAVGWLRSNNVSWHNHGSANLRGFNDTISVHEVFDPDCCSPQSSESFPVPPPPMFSRKVGTTAPLEECRQEALPYSVGVDTQPRYQVRRLNQSDWSTVLEEIRNTPPEIDPISSISSPEPLWFYTEEIRDTVAELNEVSPNALSVLWVADTAEIEPREYSMLRDVGFVVEFADSMQAAHEKLSAKRYLLVVMSMALGRDKMAAVDLLQWMPARDLVSPVVVYAPIDAVATHGGAAKKAGALFCTSGVISLLNAVNQVLEHLRSSVQRHFVAPVGKERDC